MTKKLALSLILSGLCPLVSLGQYSPRYDRGGVTTETPPNELIQEMIGRVSKDSIFARIQRLERYGTRYEYSLQRDSAATYIINTLKSWGFTPESDQFSYSLADFRSLDMVDQNIGWIVGEDTRDGQDFVLHTADGGGSWVLQPTPQGANLSAIDFVDADTGWIVGSGGGIFRTTDGGASWQTQMSGVSALLLDLGFADAQRGLAVGYGGTILRTTDGGATWSPVNSLGTSSLRKCMFLGAEQVWAVGSGGTILHSLDGGATWVKQTSGVTANLASVDFPDSLNGWVIGSMGTVLKTMDGGETWLTVPLPPEVRRDVDPKEVDLVALTPLSVLIISMSEIWKTDDGGISWKGMTNLGSHHIKKLGGESVLTYGGTAGISRSTDSGAGWQAWDQNIPRSLYATSRNCVATISGSITPEKEYLIVAHYDGPLGNTPGADDNASGTAAALEAIRILKNYKFESTIRLVATSGKETALLGSRHYVASAKAQRRDIRLVVNLDMIGYPVTADTARIIAGSYRGSSPYLDSVLAYNSRYDVGLKVDPYIDSAGEGDTYSFAFGGYETLHLSEGTPQEILQGNPYVFKPTDTSDKLDQAMVERTTQLVLSIAAELAAPVRTPQTPWTWWVPFQRWHDLRSLSVVDANTTFVAGDFGTILKTTDGGHTWAQLETRSAAALRGVWFTDANRGFAVGDAGAILRTTDGGRTWAGEVVDPAVTLNAVWFSDRTTGTVVGSPGAVYRTTDGGVTWDQKFVTPGIALNAVSFTDRSTGVFVGGAGSIYRTTDGGAKWTRQLSGMEGTGAPALLGVCYVDAETWIAIGEYGTMLRSTDGGSSWASQESGTRSHLRTVAFSDANNGIAAGDAGLILGTTDGGKTWVQRSYGLTSWFSALRFINASTAYLVGSDGMLVRTTDGGVSWSGQIGGPRVPLYGVRFTGPTTGIAVGYQGAILRTIDGGTTWEAQASGTTNHLRGVDFPEPSTGIAVGEFGTILRTTDGGVSWSDLSIPPTQTTNLSFLGVAFGDPSSGLVVGRLDSALGPQTMLTRSAILRTTDGGQNWVRVSVSWDRELSAVSFGGLSTATAVGAGGLIIRTTDRGIHWDAQEGISDPETGKEPITALRLNGVTFAGPFSGIVVGDYGTILRTLDGGATWEIDSSGTTSNLYGAWSVNGADAVVVGNVATILTTSDGGATWHRTAATTTNNLYAVHFLDVDRGTIVGDKGIVLRTALASTPTSVPGNERVLMPEDFSLSQNYPNPFNGMTNFEYRIANRGFVSLKVFDILGREIATLVDGEKLPGVYRVQWNAANFASGVYFCRMQSGNFIQTRKVLLLR